MTTQYERLVRNTRVDDEGCWIWTGMLRSGYPCFNERRDGKVVHVAAHRRMIELVHGWLFPFDEAGHYVCFKPACVHPDHLRVETKAENLSARRGYRECEGRWIPVLFPTAERLLDESIEAWWSHGGEVAHDPINNCPF